MCASPLTGWVVILDKNLSDYRPRYILYRNVFPADKTQFRRLIRASRKGVSSCIDVGLAVNCILAALLRHDEHVGVCESVYRSISSNCSSTSTTIFRHQLLFTHPYLFASLLRHDAPLWMSTLATINLYLVCNYSIVQLLHTHTWITTLFRHTAVPTHAAHTPPTSIVATEAA